MRILTVFKTSRCSTLDREAKAASEDRYSGAGDHLCLNELTAKQRERVLYLVQEGLTFRHIERLTGHRRETISRYAQRESLRSNEAVNAAKRELCGHRTFTSEVQRFARSEKAITDAKR